MKKSLDWFSPSLIKCFVQWALVSWATYSTLFLVYLVLTFLSSIRSTTINTSSGFISGVRQHVSDEEKDYEIEIITVHGIGRHCIGYSRNFSDNIASALGYNISDSHDLNYLNSLHENLKDDENPSRQRYLSYYDEDYGYVDENCNPIGIDTSNSLCNLREEVCSPQNVNITDTSYGNAIISQSLSGPNLNSSSQTCAAIKFLSYSSVVKEDCFAVSLDFFVDQTDVNLIGDNDTGIRSSDVGFIYVREFNSEGKPPLRFYEVLWDPSTDWIQPMYFLSDHEDYIDGYERSIANNFIKSNIINRNIADAIAYIGELKPVMQYPLFQTLCLTAFDEQLFLQNSPQTRSSELATSRDFNCLNYNSGELSRDTENDQIIMVSHSLGTKMLFDVLGNLALDNSIEEDRVDTFLDKYIEELNNSRVAHCNGQNSCIPISEMFSHDTPGSTNDIQHLYTVRNSFMEGLKSIFTLANQVPLIEVGRLENPFQTTGIIDISFGDGFYDFLNQRREYLSCNPLLDPNCKDNPQSESTSDNSQCLHTSGSRYRNVCPLNIVSYSDPNDLLSYDLKCWYYSTSIKGSEVSKILQTVYVISHLDESDVELLRSELDSSLDELIDLSKAIDECNPDGPTAPCQNVITRLHRILESGSFIKPNFRQEQFAEIYSKIDELENQYLNNVFNNSCDRRNLTPPFDKYYNFLWKIQEDSYGIRLSSVNLNLSGLHLPFLLSGPESSHSYFEQSDSQANFWNTLVEGN